MAYSYDFFSKQLVGSDKINLTDVFPDIQAEAKQATNVSYGLADIVLFLQDVTQDFQRAERQYIDLDNAIQSIVKKYFDSKNTSNPFKLNTTGVVQVDDSPRAPSIVKDGKMKGKGTPKSTIFKKDEPVPAPAPVVSAAPIVDEQAGEREYLKEIITDMEKEGLSDDPDVIAEIADQTLVAFGFGDDAEVEARKWFKDNGFDYDKYNQ
jgi:hypothetical protein